MEQQDQRNFLLAIVLMFGLLMGWQFFFIEPQQRAAREARERAAEEQATQSPQQRVQANLRPHEEVVAEETSANTRVALDTPSIDGSISLRGARIDDVRLKNYYETVEAKEAGDPSGEVVLMSPDGSERAFYAVVNWRGASGLPADNALWTQTSTGPLSPTNPLDIRWQSETVTIDRRIEIDQDYMFTVTDTLTNQSGASIDVQPIAYMMQNSLEELLKPPPQAHAGAIGMYGPDRKNQTRKYKDLDKGKTVLEEAEMGWIGLTTKYWMAAAIPEQGEPVTMRASADKANGRTTFRAGFSATPYTVAPGDSLTKTTRIFAGAKRVDVLDRYQKEEGVPDFTNAVDWSWLWFITKPFFWLLKTFEGWFGAFGWAIMALTVCVKVVFFPMQWKMYEAMSKMRKLAPEMKAIQERFKADKARQQQEIMALYKKEKANPLSGCLPMIPQMFVFYALFQTLSATIEMRHTPFVGWIKDMSAPDPTSIWNLFGLLPFDPAAVPLVGGLIGGVGLLAVGLWPIIYGITMFALQGMSTPPTDPMQKAIMRFLPLIFLFIFAGFAAGLVIYWCWSNIITMIQQYYIMRKNGVETEFDKFLKKYVFKPKAPAE